MENIDQCSCLSECAGPSRRGILQIHPSLRCNLSCAHCYSISGPASRMELDAATVCEVVFDAAQMGYEVLSLSGGEPLMYRGLETVLAYAKSLGMVTTVTTNGLFTGPARLKRLAELIDVLAISLDGPPETHNKIRGAADAFKRLEAGLKNIRKSGIPFGFIHTLTRQNWEHLLWVADFATNSGARLLQIHPLELNGRAIDGMSGEIPDEDILAKVYVLAFVLANKYGGTMQVQLDLLHRDILLEQPGLVYAEEEDKRGDVQTTPANVIGLLVLEPDGTVVPSSYGFARQYKICNIKEQRLIDGWSSYRTKGLQEFRTLCKTVWEELVEQKAPLLSNWHEVVTSRSHRNRMDLVAT